nr:acyl-CoA dehydrogenase family protein [Aestuariicella hydrocarbonica]
MLEQAARFSDEFLLELAERGDRVGCSLDKGGVTLPAGTDQAYQAWCELGFPALSLSESQGGLGVPLTVQLAVQELIDGANLAFGMLCINQRCATKALLGAVSQEPVEQWLAGLADGSLAATIAISEPQAGSDVGRIATRATSSPEGGWTLNGSKIWISYGDHDATDNILHLVLARTAGGGTRGLSLFAVPKRLDDEDNGVSVLRLEEKMGLHASPTCVLALENTRGYLIGEEGRGLVNLFPMMNAMRQAVATQGAAVANAATLQALDYAGTRPQGGRADAPARPIIEHADVSRMLLEMTAKSELLRALSLRTASYEDRAACCEDDDADNARDWQQLAGLLLPVAKTLSAEWGFEVANQGIQVLGGYGYTSDYPMERMARDVRVGSIYEGTSGIQALDFAHRKLLGDQLGAMQRLLALIEADLAGSQADNPLRAPLEQILSIYREVLRCIQQPDWLAGGGAYPLLRLSGVLLCCWNGVTLYQAAHDDSEYQRRVRQAMDLFSVGLAAEAESWAAKVSLKRYSLSAQ